MTTLASFKRPTGKYEFECWEIEFPNDPDGENTRGISQGAAKLMLMLGVVTVKKEGIVRNAYGKKVYSHCFVPADDKAEAVAWKLMLAEGLDDISDEQIHRMVVLNLLAEIYHSRHYGDYDSDYDEFDGTYLPWRGMEHVTPNEQWDIIFQEIPRFAVITHDETYSMIHMYETQREALRGLNSSLGNDTLGTNGDVIDLDDTVLDTHKSKSSIKAIGAVGYRIVTMSVTAFKAMSLVLGNAPIGTDSEALGELRSIFNGE